MCILIFENNLLWSSKLKTGLASLGHEAIVLSGSPPVGISADLAIVNLSQPNPPPKELIEQLRLLSIKTIAHAGHKEKELLALGKEAGANMLVTNGELSAKLEDVIARAKA
jgi:hypothetical protein